MRWAVLATAILLTVFLMAPLAQMGVVLANPFMFGPHIGIASPQQFKENNYQTIYQTTSIPIQIQINTPLDYPEIVKVYYILDLDYSLDNNPQKALTISSPQTSTYSEVVSTLYWATGTLENLPNGTHTLDVYALTAEGETPKSGTRTFMVNAISSSNSEQSFAASLIFVASVGIALAAIGLFVYFKKRKH